MGDRGGRRRNVRESPEKFELIKKKETVQDVVWERRRRDKV